MLFVNKELINYYAQILRMEGILKMTLCSKVSDVKEQRICYEK